MPGSASSPNASSFSNLSLAEPLARAVAEMGYETMTPIQAQAIPVVLTGKDVMGAAQTGTGKTAAFSLPLAAAHAQARERLHVAGAPSGARAGAAAHARTGRPGGPAGQAVRQVHQPAQRGGVRRHRHEAADGGTQEGRRSAGRHAGPPAGPHRSQERGAQPGRVRGAGRGGPHARHRLPAGPAAHPVLPAQAAHHAAVLGHLLARDQAAGQQLPAGPGDDRGGAPERDGLHRRTAFLQRARRRQAARAQADRAPARHRSRPSCSSTASSAARAWRARWSAKA